MAWTGGTVLPTEYGNTRFRSRTEARWAVFYDALGISWRYELEGFDLDGLWYLPDFWLPDQKTWIEIKGFEIDDKAREKARRLASLTGYRVIIFVDTPQLPNRYYYEDDSGLPQLADLGFKHNASEALVPGPEGGAYWDNHYVWCQCWRCGEFDIQFEGRLERARCGCLADCHKEYFTSYADPLVGAALFAQRAFSKVGRS